MRLGDRKLFRDKYVLATMLELRVYGWSYTSLALLFDCDRTSVEFQCHRYLAEPLDKVYTVERIANKVIEPLTETKWKFRNGEKVNKGFSYKEYLKRANIPIER